MVPERQIDALIEAGWHVLESDFDEVAFQQWRAQAFNCLMALLGSDHAYTEHFRNNIQKANH